MFGGARAAGIDRIQIHLEVVGDVAAHHRALHEMQIVELVGNARGIMQVLHATFAVGAPVHLDQMHSGTGSAVMDLGARQFQIVLWITAIQGDGAVGRCNGVFDQRTGKAQPAVVAQNGTGTGHIGDPRRGRVGKADLFQRVQNGQMDAVHRGGGQRIIGAA